MKTHIISVINHKGGVGKTTSAANIGAGLHLFKRRVLMVDIDPQANLTRHFGLSKTSERSVYGALNGEYPLPRVGVKDGLDVVPSHQDMIGWEKSVADEPGRELLLREALSPVVGDYDYVLIDCPPSLNLLPVNALSASSEVLITVEPSLFSIDGMGSILSAVSKVRARINKDLCDYRILITRFFASKVLHRNAEEIIRQNYGGRVLKTAIRTNVALEEAVMNGVDIFQYDSASNGAKDYKSVCEEIMRSEELRVKSEE